MMSFLSLNTHLIQKVVEILQYLVVFLQQKTVEENACIKELKKYHLQLEQVCNIYVYVCVNMRVHVLCVVYMGAFKLC